MIKLMRDNLVSTLFLLILSVSLAGNVYLGRIVRSESRIPLHLPVEANLHQQLDTMSFAQADGSKLRINFRGSRPTVLYVFSPTCSWCEKNLQNIQALSVQAGSHYNFIGLSVGSHDLSSYLIKHPLPFSAYEGVSTSDLKLLDFRGTPQTILINSSGVVEHNWSGAYIDASADTIQKYFAVRLPGLMRGLASPPAPLSSVRPGY